MNMKPIKTELISITKCEQLKNRLLVAIDAGNVFTRVIFLNKNNKEQLFNENEPVLNMELNLFHTEDFEHVLEWIKETAYIPDDNSYSVHISGSYAVLHQRKVKSTLNKKTLCIDEYMAVAAGAKFTIENIGIDNFLDESVPNEPLDKLDNDFISKIIDSMKKKLISDKKSLNDSYPFVFHVQGSRSLTYSFDENGSCSFLDMLQPGGKTFLGLSKCLLNTNDYDEIIYLASKGNRCNVDTQAKEMFDPDIESPYGRLPQEMPIFPFGKCMDMNQQIQLPSKEDIALSSVALHCANLFMSCSQICMIEKITKIYLSGNLFNSSIFQREFNSMPFITLTGMKFEFLNFVYSGVIGAMICDDNHIKGQIGNLHI